MPEPSAASSSRNVDRGERGVIGNPQAISTARDAGSTPAARPGSSAAQDQNAEEHYWSEVAWEKFDREQREAASAAQGLHGKYHGLRRTRDDSLVEGWYFVIREGDEAGKAALLAYADACEGYAPELAADLRQHVHEERLMDGLYEAGWER